MERLNMDDCLSVCLGGIAGLILTVAGVTLPTKAASHQTPEQFAAKATVRVVLEDGYGSGVVIGNGLVVTAKHVVEGVDKAEVVLSTGAKKNARVLWAGTGDVDVALLEVATDDIAPATLACEPQKRDTRVFTHGHPLNMRAVTTRGVVASEVPVQEATRDGVVLDLTILPGNSGGGVWGEDGRLVGLADAVRAINGNPTGLSVMAPATLVCKLLGRG